MAILQTKEEMLEAAGYLQKYMDMNTEIMGLQRELSNNTKPITEEQKKQIQGDIQTYSGLKENIETQIASKYEGRTLRQLDLELMRRGIDFTNYQTQEAQSHQGQSGKFSQVQEGQGNLEGQSTQSTDDFVIGKDMQKTQDVAKEEEAGTYFKDMEEANKRLASSSKTSQELLEGNLRLDEVKGDKGGVSEPFVTLNEEGKKEDWVKMEGHLIKEHRSKPPEQESPEESKVRSEKSSRRSPGKGREPPDKDNPDKQKQESPEESKARWEKAKSKILGKGREPPDKDTPGKQR